ncbi:GTP-binding protein [Streptosporangium roseum]|uniref:ABC transporter n=1 Tax=Streptosporangium roseum (strain ATCC 12428 / DSM 43021 / JCM 3005 / KCTC 9067 / NCIMB 10171 / NRRL 2505 / NI 9100) TaxID=479432 RepID=D2BE01_STRRD|nr:GTP-binding protein [Streptosporangium roseum]ACZ90047.1 putative ABC transporter [Streptosporangium roseum DSM 43021]
MTTVGTTQTRQGLGSRLAALARIVELGPGRVDPKLLTESGQLLMRAGDRLKLSSDHTVVALAGGTGSGKSTLFNSVSGLELSPTGVRRPTTARTHACVWGLDGAGPLLDWLQIQWRHRFARASALDKGESRLHGLILLDLPDHDSIRALTDTEADRLIQIADLVVWVLDPQKYADASTHRRYVTELAGHDAVTIFVLNQVDRLDPEELAECVADLEDLLRREGVENPVIVTTSAISGKGVDGLRAVLAETVVRRRAAIQRLEADLDRLTLRLAKIMPADGIPAASAAIDDARRIGLTDALCDAVGVPAVGEAMENVYGVRSMEWVGWPYTRWAAKLRPDPLNSLRLGDLRDEIRGLSGGSVSAQPAEVDNAVQALADGLTSGMHEAWRNGIRDAARSRSAQLPQVLSEELSEVAPRLDRVPGWWRLLLLWQYLLVLLFVAGLAWFGTALAYGVFGAGELPAGLAVFGEAASLPWVGLMTLSVLGLGLLTAVASRNFVALGAGSERDRLEREMRRRVGGVAGSMVIEPVERELARYNEFYSAMRSVQG